MSGFVDQAQLHARAGDGGAGAVSWRREAHVDRGGPDGGDGGHGGDVWLVASVNQSSLLGFRDHPFRRATDGVHGSGSKRHGARGKDLVVPGAGRDGGARQRAARCTATSTEDGERFLVAEGGQGGRGNARFLSNRRRAPAFAEQGEKGQERWLDMELKLMADVALVGFPNAGKSTLISTVSAAKPKIADYPFTTLEPHLGVVRVGGVRDGTEFVMADIPGLVEGAAEGKGLGPPVPAPHRAGPGAGGAARPRPAQAGGVRRPSSCGSCWPSSAATGPTSRAAADRGGVQGRPGVPTTRACATWCSRPRPGRVRPLVERLAALVQAARAEAARGHLGRDRRAPARPRRGGRAAGRPGRLGRARAGRRAGGGLLGPERRRGAGRGGAAPAPPRRRPRPRPGRRPRRGRGHGRAT